MNSAMVVPARPNGLAAAEKHFADLAVFEQYDRAHAFGGISAGIILAAFVTLALEFSHYSLPELLPTYWL